MMNICKLAVPLLAICLLVVTGCPKDGQQAPSGTPAATTAAQIAKGGTLRLPLEIAIDDPVLLELDFSDHRLFALARCLELPLVQCDAEGNLSPGLADSWETPDGGLSWSFNLREFEPEADSPGYLGQQFEINIRRILRGTDGPLSAQIADLIEGAAAYRQGTGEHISGIKIENSTLSISLTRPYQRLPMWLSQPGLGAWIEFGPISLNDANELKAAATGFGAFSLSRIEGDELVLTPNPNAVDDKPLVDELRFACLPDRAGQLARFRSGRLHAALVPQSELTGISNDNELKYSSVRNETAATFIGVFDLHEFPWGDQQFHSKVPLRQALNWGLDRAYLEEYTNGELIAWPHFLPEHFKDGIPGDLLVQPPFPLTTRIEDARAALRRADHWDGIHLPRGMDLAWLKDESLDGLANEIREYWNEISIKLKPLPDEKATLLKRIDNGAHEIVLRKSYPAYPDPEALLYPQLYSALAGTGGNWSMLNDQEIDAMLAEMQATADELQRHKLQQDICRKLEDNALFVFLGYIAPTLLISPELADYQLTPYDFDASLPAQDFTRLGLKAGDQE